MRLIDGDALIQVFKQQKRYAKPDWEICIDKAIQNIEEAPTITDEYSIEDSPLNCDIDNTLPEPMESKIEFSDKFKYITDIDTESLSNVLDRIETKVGPDNLIGFADGHDFSVAMLDLLVSKNGYIIDTGNWENANYACLYRLIEKIKKHPFIWSWFFMVA